MSGQSPNASQQVAQKSVLYLCFVFVFETCQSTGAGEVPQAILQGLCCPVEWSLEGEFFENT